MEALPDNPDYLTELIPYRCPKCGDLQRFATLRELKRHLEGDHSFKMGCIKPRKRLRVFSQDAKDKNKLLDNTIMSSSSGDRCSEDSARLSPLLQSYKEEAKMLEMQVEFAKQEELRNKLSGIESKAKDTKSSSPSGSATDFNGAASVRDETYSKTDPSNDRIGDANSTSFVNHGQTFTNVPSSLSKNDFYNIPPLRSGYSEFRNVLDSLNQEVIRSRQRQWESAESLHKAEDVLLGMEKAAEEKCQEQRRIIQKLLKGLNDKEDTLRSASNELDALQLQRQRLLKETEDLFYKADEKNTILRRELEQKERQMSCLNRELEKLKFYSETELKRKDEELKNANKATKCLEWERENLTREAEELLKRANLDSEGLRKANERKEEQLKYVNKELDKLRWEQQDLLEQSIELYKKADEGTSLLKGMLKAKDQQLNNALEGLKHMHEVQTRLLEESRWLTQQADENSDIMKKLLVKKEEQFRVAQHELEKLKYDERNLRESSASFASRAESNSAIIENLQELVWRKEEELGKTKTELSSLKKFIRQTAEKERVARTKLEKFIGELIDRADRAEKEIRTLTRTGDKTSPEHVKPSRPPSHGMQSIWTRKHAEDFATGKHIHDRLPTKNMQDPSARRQRDSKQRPQKPCIQDKINPLGHQIVDLGVDSWFEHYPGFSLRPAVNRVPDQLEESPGRLITHQVTEANNSDRTVVESARPEETNYSFGNDQVEDSYTFAGDIIPPRNLKKFSVAPIPIVKPTRRSQAGDNLSDYDLSRGKYDPRALRLDQSCNSDKGEEDKHGDTAGYVNNGNFEQIIDENGIMWEDNQDTLPDISDSELDRISPSGTEAVSGNTTNCPVTPKYREDVSVLSRQSLQSRQNQTVLSKKGNIPNSGTVEKSNHSNGQVSKFGADVHSDVNMSRQTYENPPQKNQPISSVNEKISNSEFVWSNFDNGKYTTGRSLSASDLHSSERYFSKSSSSNSNSFLKSQSPLDSRSKYLSGKEESKRSKLFQPIKSPIAKSGSDQDLTSGGREVHATFIVRENNDTKCISPDSMLAKKFNNANKEERSTDGTLSHNSEYNRKSPISDIPKLLTEDNCSVKSDYETSFRNIDLAQKPTRLGPNTEAFIRGSPSVKAFKDKLDTVAQKYGVKSRYVKTPEAKQAQSSSYQDKVNVIAKKYSLKSIISNPTEKADFRRQSCPERATSPRKSQSHSQYSSSGGISNPEKRYGSDKQPDKGESSKYDLHLDNDNSFSRDGSSSFEGQHNLDRKPSEIGKISCDTLPAESGEISDGRSASSEKEFSSGVERQSSNETHVDQDIKISNDRFSVSDTRITPNKPTRPDRHESLDEKINAEVRDNSMLSDMKSRKRTILRTSPMHDSSSDAVDEKLKEADYTDDWEMDNVWSDASQHSNVLASPSDENLNKTDESSIKHEHWSRDKENNGQEDKVKEIESVQNRDVSYEFSDMSQQEKMVKKMDMCMPDARNDPSSVLNPGDSAKGTFVKHDAGNTLESERNYLRSDHSTNALELSDDNNEGLRYKSRESINMNFKDAALASLSEGQSIKQPINTITTMADVHQEDLDDCKENVPEMDDLPEYAQALSDLQQPGSMFAEPIIESSSVDGDSNTQSFMDHNNLTETELDTDADSHRISHDFSSGADKDGFKVRVKKKVYSKSRIKRQIAKPHVLSPASSQASLDQLDRLPCSRREDTKKRREVLYHIFSFLDTSTLCQMAAVCKEWKIVSRNPRLWQRVQLKNDKISSQFLMTISKWCTKLKFLTLEDLKPRNRRWGETLEEYNVKILACLEPGLEQLLKQCESTLIGLRIVNCGHLLTSKALWAASGYSRLLQHVTYLSDIEPVGPEVMWALGAGCRDIRTLAIPPLFPCQNIGRFNTKCVQLIGKFFHDLEVLNIGGPNVDLNSLVSVAQSCQRLQSVELTHMSEMTQAIATSVCNQGLSKLQTLIFTCTPVALDALKIFFTSCAHLKQITIQLGPKDYSTATKKKSEKEYEAYVDQLQKLKSNPGLGTILQLKVQPIIKVESSKKEERGILSWFTEKLTTFSVEQTLTPACSL